MNNGVRLRYLACLSATLAEVDRLVAGRLADRLHLSSRERFLPILFSEAADAYTALFLAGFAGNHSRRISKKHVLLASTELFVMAFYGRLHY